jgi:hypothetical protein
MFHHRPENKENYEDFNGSTRNVRAIFDSANAETFGKVAVTRPVMNQAESADPVLHVHAVWRLYLDGKEECKRQLIIIYRYCII